MGFLATDETGAGRVETSVIFTEEYMDRIQGLFTDIPAGSPAYRSPAPVRGVLLQNVWGGQDGLMQLIGRDGVTSAFWVEIVGKNLSPTTNAFKLRLVGTNTDPEDPTNTASETIGESLPIPFLTPAIELPSLLLPISDLLTPENITVGIGNPYFSTDLLVYGDVIPAVAAQPAKPGPPPVPAVDAVPPSSLIGVWYVRIDSNVFPQYDLVTLEAFLDDQAKITGLSAISCRPTLDLLSTETTIVTDCDYRTEAYPWQVGTIASCLDYTDVGFGIIRSTFRNFSII